ncbi:hypothetical protein D0T25_30515 [Duganella sp. BJB488]|uniref:hypothetical protein n=1 Tax=unclassified Duganella TaxID=2636909 RepID=UPI000ED63558|nr:MULTISPECIES: hypothetical protein [unclassified Duganella]RFP12239.1 hypothetical protein D0T25_30515 [Duganella sp. BJB488]
MKPVPIAAAVLLLAAAGWMAWPAGGASQPSGAAAGQGGSQAGGDAARAAQWPPATQEPAARELKFVPLTPVDSGGSAWMSMSAARENGDPRTPPIERDAEPRSAPTPAQLADPKAYQQYEEAQHTRLLGAYVAAATTELPRLQADLERGRQAGIPPEQLAKLEEKIARIQRLSAQIVKDHPQMQGHVTRP